MTGVVPSILHSFALFLGVMVFTLLYSTWRKNPFVNIYILLIIFSNLARIPFYLSYTLGWQHAFNDVPFPFSVLLLCNVVFFYNYIKVLVEHTPFKWSALGWSLSVPCLMFVLNMLFELYVIDLFFLKFINFIASIGFILFFTVKITYIIVDKVWSPGGDFANKPYARNWLSFLYVFFLLLALRLLIAVPYEFFLNKALHSTLFLPIHSGVWIVIYITFFIYPEILYGIQRGNHLRINSDNNDIKSMKLQFNWLPRPKPISNRVNMQLALKIEPKIHEIITILESDEAMNIIVEHPEINIESLANKLSIPKSHMYFVFKYYADFNFVSYRSKIRVFYALKKMQEDYLATNTLDALARESGFSSYNPFYSAFKMELNMGPKEFLTRIKTSIKS